MRWSCVASLAALAACTANNPEFGLDGGDASSGRTDGGSSSSIGASQEGSSADTSSEGAQGDKCPEPSERAPHVKLLGSSLGAGATNGSIALTDGVLHVDCTSPCASALGGECVPFAFEIDPPLWGNWAPPEQCFRFQWSGTLEAIQDLRVGAPGEREQLVVLGPEPLYNNALDIDLELQSGCSCGDYECCPTEPGEYALVVHADEDVVLDKGNAARDDVHWSEATYRVEAGGASVVPSCDTPKRVQFRAYRTG